MFPRYTLFAHWSVTHHFICSHIRPAQICRFIPKIKLFIPFWKRVTIIPTCSRLDATSNLSDPLIRTCTTIFAKGYCISLLENWLKTRIEKACWNVQPISTSFNVASKTWTYWLCLVIYGRIWTYNLSFIPCLLLVWFTTLRVWFIFIDSH